MRTYLVLALAALSPLSALAADTPTRTQVSAEERA
jgi:hypothetical protein